jgi:hypothetical protein
MPAAAGAPLPTAVTAAAESEAAIRRAIGLLPRRPQEVSVVGVEQVDAADRERFLRAEAFFSKGHPTVYLTRHSPVLKAAQGGSSFHVHALAAIIWHEMAHMEGADESEAQRREESMWTRFVRDGRVERVTALRYLKAMAHRRHQGRDRYARLSVTRLTPRDARP